MATKRRGRKPIPEHERKDRLVQARVDEALEEKLRDEARRQRMSVSQLIRNVLQDTFQLVDGLVANTAQLTERAARDVKKLADSARRFKRPAPPTTDPPPKKKP